MTIRDQLNTELEQVIQSAPTTTAGEVIFKAALVDKCSTVPTAKGFGSTTPLFGVVSIPNSGVNGVYTDPVDGSVYVSPTAAVDCSTLSPKASDYYNKYASMKTIKGHVPPAFYSTTLNSSIAHESSPEILTNSNNSITIVNGVSNLAGQNAYLVINANGLTRVNEPIGKLKAVKGNVFYSIGTDGTYSSTDGITWSLVTTSYPTNLFYDSNNTAYPNSRNSGSVQYTSYTPSLGFTQQWGYGYGSNGPNLFTYFGGKFYAVHQNTGVFTSTDLVTWVDETSAVLGAVGTPVASTTYYAYFFHVISPTQAVFISVNFRGVLQTIRYTSNSGTSWSTVGSSTWGSISQYNFRVYFHRNDRKKFALSYGNTLLVHNGNGTFVETDVAKLISSSIAYFSWLGDTLVITSGPHMAVSRDNGATFGRLITGVPAIDSASNVQLTSDNYRFYFRANNNNYLSTDTLSYTQLGEGSLNGTGISYDATKSYFFTGSGLYAVDTVTGTISPHFRVDDNTGTINASTGIKVGNTASGYWVIPMTVNPATVSSYSSYIRLADPFIDSYTHARISNTAYGGAATGFTMMLRIE